MQNKYTQPLLMEKIIAAFSYITLGFIGFIWLLIGIFTKKSIRPFLKYHIFQSIFLAITYFLLCQILNLILNILSIIPIINQIILQITFYLNAPFFFGFSFIQGCIYAILFYLAFTCFQGQYSYLPWISDIIKANIRD